MFQFENYFLGLRKENAQWWNNIGIVLEYPTNNYKDI